MASINHLDEEMIFRILSLLPVLSLLRYKSVCKSWKSIISEPHFIQAHLTVSHSKQPPYSVLRVVPKGALEGFYIETRGEDSVKLTLPVPEYMFGMNIHVCSCNGLVTLADVFVGVLYIWNPLTRLFKLLPKSNIGPNCFDLRFTNSIGFWFDSVSNDYKILRLVFGSFSDGNNHLDVIVAELYSVNADSWEEIRVPKEMHGFRRDPFSKCVCVNTGVLYIEGMEEFLSFDLHDEVFRLHQYPNSGKRMSYFLNFYGSLAVIMKSGGDGSVLSLWKLDGVGNNVSWTKMFNIEPNLKMDLVVLYLGDAHFLALDSDVGFFFYDDGKKENKTPLARVFRRGMSAVQFTGSPCFTRRV
ncbi:putative F-box protein At4g09190 isoform X1 [Apium graveolens]|uniref:putative F-box protein At4g09190 isoform X1 n=1 Tax=Apium graveolens TaxID=4045 RepID=UPI003D78B432